LYVHHWMAMTCPCRVAHSSLGVLTTVLYAVDCALIVQLLCKLCRRSDDERSTLWAAAAAADMTHQCHLMLDVDGLWLQSVDPALSRSDASISQILKYQFNVNISYRPRKYSNFRYTGIEFFILSSCSVFTICGVRSREIFSNFFILRKFHEIFHYYY